jgi:hypothetical protein
MPCDDGCKTPSSCGVKYHERQLKKLRKDAEDRKKGRAKIKGFVHAFEAGLRDEAMDFSKQPFSPAAFRNCVLTICERQPGEYKGNDVINIPSPTIKKIRAAVEGWLNECNVIPEKFWTAHAIQDLALEVLFVIVWHTH